MCTALTRSLLRVISVSVVYRRLSRRADGRGSSACLRQCPSGLTRSQGPAAPRLVSEPCVNSPPASSSYQTSPPCCRLVSPSLPSVGPRALLTTSCLVIADSVPPNPSFQPCLSEAVVLTNLLLLLYIRLSSESEHDTNMLQIWVWFLS